MYILIPLIHYQFLQFNIITILLFTVFIAVDIGFLTNYRCFSIKQIILSLFTGGLIGIMYISILLGMNKKEMIYIPGIPQGSMCDIPKKKGYRCRLKKKETQ